MQIEQFYDEALAHASYAILSDSKMALVDPGRDVQPYLDFAEKHDAKIEMVLETHPHADFVSSHKEWIDKYKIKVYINPEVGANYAHTGLSHGDEVTLGELTIRTLFTPGHSPDHNSYLLLDGDQEMAVFTGDSLFVGDVGRPDLREGTGHVKSKKEDLAEMMFSSLNEVFAKLDDEVKVYPAHGPGSLCGKNMSPERKSTIGKEKRENWAFQQKDKDQFVKGFLEGQPFIPQYFPYDVEMNRSGAAALEEALDRVPELNNTDEISGDSVIVDVRDEEEFKKGHPQNAFNIQLGEEDSKFETWLGAIISPREHFYLVAADQDQAQKALKRIAKIGYEANVKGIAHRLGSDLVQAPRIDLEKFEQNTNDYTVVDVRNESETREGKIFEKAMTIPLPELRQSLDEIPADKPVVVHCAGGYRSAIASSILEANLSEKVFDLSDAVRTFSD